MAKRYDLLFETSRFNLTEPSAHFINECCYGEDLAAWLRSRLAELNIEATEPGQEDWGWHICVRQCGQSYFIGIAGNAANASSGNQGEWRFMIEKRRGLLEKLTGRNPFFESDALVAVLKRIITDESDIRFLRAE